MVVCQLNLGGDPRLRWPWVRLLLRPLPGKSDSVALAEPAAALAVAATALAEPAATVAQPTAAVALAAAAVALAAATVAVAAAALLRADVPRARGLGVVVLLRRTLP